MKTGKVTVLGAGSFFDGTLRFTGSVHIEGTFRGEIVSDGHLVIGKGAKVTGRVTVGELVVTGAVEGEMRVEKLTQLYRDAEVTGTLATARLAMEEGAVLQGTLVMGENALQHRSSSLEAPEQSAPGADLLETEVIKQ